jgi:hypothetical protein
MVSPGQTPQRFAFASEQLFHHPFTSASLRLSRLHLLVMHIDPFSPPCAEHSNFTQVDISQRPQDHGFGLWVQGALFNHSCVPNCCYGFLGDVMFVRTVTELRAGDELTVSYVSAHDSLQERDAKLQRRGFVCRCELCERQRKVDDEEYNSARDVVLQRFQSNKPIHTDLYWHGMVQRAEKVFLFSSCNSFVYR